MGLPREGELILAMDLAAVRAHNGTAAAPFRFHTDLGPEPFVGSPDAPVVILMGNPGYSDRDAEAYRDPGFREAARANLEHRRQGFANYLLDPTLSWASGSRWWRRHLRSVLDVVGDRRAAEGILVLESVPYHSLRYQSVDVPSQAYTRALLRGAMDRGAAIVFARGPWLQQDETLGDHPGLIRMRNPRRAWVSPGNLSEGGFERIVDALR